MPYLIISSNEITAATAADKSRDQDFSETFV